MTKDQAIEQKLRVLEEENAQLAERAEDSLLIGLVSENIQQLSDGVQVFEDTLERISILKSIPYATCCKFYGSELTPIATYSIFSEQEHVGYPLDIETEIIQELEYGPTVVDADSGFQYNFDKSLFAPKKIALIPFTTQTIPNGVFIFIDNDPEGNRLATILVLLNQVVELAVAKYDNLYLLEALTRSKQELEFRVKQRTNDLARINKALEIEIKERTESEKTLRETHQTFLRVLDSIDATIYVAGLKSHRILFMNKHMIDSFGQNSTGEICYKAFRGEKQPCDFCTNNRLLDSGGNPGSVVTWQGENPITGKLYMNYDRAIKWVDGRIVRLQVATDITQIKTMEQQLSQSQKFEAIGTLAGGVAHDFNNLLMGIQGRVSLMSMEAPSSHEYVEHIDAIEDYIKSAADLTRQLLGFARGGKYEVKPTDINELVRKSINMFGRTKKELKIHVKLHNTTPVVNVDSRQIEQVLLNLYVNAWQAMLSGGQLYIETKITKLDDIQTKAYRISPGRYVRISVADTGTGMDDTTRQQIFDPFFTTKEKQRGTGLGLASAYGIIKNHDGFITVDSQVGQGTTFNIYLPRSEKVVVTEALPVDEFMRGSETILLVDDENMIIEVGQAMLEKLGYHVLVASGGQKAIDEIQEKGANIDLVLLDLIMPGIDGGQVFDHIKKIQPQLPVLLSSGYAIDGQASEIMQKGCNGFIQKPFNVKNLSQKVRKILDELRSSAQE